MKPKENTCQQGELGTIGPGPSYDLILQSLLFFQISVKLLFVQPTMTSLSRNQLPNMPLSVLYHYLSLDCDT
jgi:hypothetical protein